MSGRLRSVSLRHELDRIRAAIRDTLSPAQKEAIGRTVERLRMLQLVEHSLAVGDVLPDFALPDSHGDLVESRSLLERGPLVLSFFRGGWCPYCRTTLRGARGSAAACRAGWRHARRGRAVPPGGAAAHRRARSASSSCSSATRMRALLVICGVHYAMTEEHAAYYRGQGLDLPSINAGTGWELPLPGAYVVGQDGIITFAFAEPDWSRRAEPDDLAALVDRLAQAADAAANG